MSYNDNDPKHRAELEAYLTRPATPKEKDMETYVKNTTANNANPNTFKKLVKEDEAEAMEKRGQQTVALRTAANKLKTNKADYVLTEDRNGLMVNKNRTIAVRDSFIAKQFNKALDVEPEATPEQVGKLAERLERNRQMTGAKPTKLNDLKDRYKNKPIQKKPIKPFKFPEFKIDPILPPSYFKPTAPDPELARLERRFNQMVEESNKPKGLPGILGLNKKI